MKQIPNIICIFRVLMTIAMATWVLENPNNNTVLNISFFLTIFSIILDGVDGIVARALNATSDFGAFFDIACDRIVELILISLFSTLGWIPFWILIVFLVRGILVDGIRGFASKEGQTAFGEKSMMKSKIGFFLTSSRFMRLFYGGIKAIAFAFMFLTQSTLSQYHSLEMILIYLTVFLCIVRGVPVLVEGRKYFKV